MTDIIVDMQDAAKPMVKVTPISMMGINHSFAVDSEKEERGAIYGYETNKEAVRARAKIIKLFKENGYLISQ